jgi:hypothetical protein
MVVKELSPSVRAAAFAALERSYSRRADVPHVDEATELLVLECLERVRFLDARTRLSHHCADETVLNTQENDAQVLHFACLPATLGSSRTVQHGHARQAVKRLALTVSLSLTSSQRQIGTCALQLRHGGPSV